MCARPIPTTAHVSARKESHRALARAPSFGALSTRTTALPKALAPATPADLPPRHSQRTQPSMAGRGCQTADVQLLRVRNSPIGIKRCLWAGDGFCEFLGERANRANSAGERHVCQRKTVRVNRVFKANPFSTGLFQRFLEPLPTRTAGPQALESTPSSFNGYRNGLIAYPETAVRLGRNRDGSLFWPECLAIEGRLTRKDFRPSEAKAISNARAEKRRLSGRRSAA